MEKIIYLLLTLMIVVACERTKKPFDIRGSWYTDLGDGGTYDSLINYGEVYITDTTFEYQEEQMGQGGPQRYFIKGDSIYKCWSPETNCSFIPMFKIDKWNSDTLWLTINSNYLSKNKKQNTFFVRLPSDEKGYYDHIWTKENRDSLKTTVVNDWYRRRVKYHCYRLNEMDYYDSLLRVGEWNWTMKEIRDAEKAEEDYLKRTENGR
jgi:hypothetical protein